jgi:hypothetical protein
MEPAYCSLHFESPSSFYLTCLKADKSLYAGIIYSERVYNSATETKSTDSPWHTLSALRAPLSRLRFVYALPNRVRRFFYQEC